MKPGCLAELHFADPRLASIDAILGLNFDKELNAALTPPNEDRYASKY
jgi:hypothetical protein